MKAILKYGQFTAMIELPHMLPMVSVMKPMDAISVMPLTEEEIADVTRKKIYRLDFRYIKRLDDDIHLYEFEAEI